MRIENLKKYRKSFRMRIIRRKYILYSVYFILPVFVNFKNASNFLNFLMARENFLFNTKEKKKKLDMKSGFLFRKIS